MGSGIAPLVVHGRTKPANNLRFHEGAFRIRTARVRRKFLISLLREGCTYPAIVDFNLAQLALLLVATFITAALSAIAGFGGAILLLPIFVAAFGARDAVAVLTIAQLASNGSRVVLNRREVVGHLVKIFAIGAVPAAIIGSLLLTTAPIAALTRIIGGFLILSVLWLRFRPQAARFSDRGFIVVGAASGMGSALLGSVGPLVAPFFLARGLVRGAYIGTEAAAALVMHVTKLIVFGAVALLTVTTIAYGLALTPASITGSYVGKRIVDRMPIPVFTALVEIGLLIGGLIMLLSA